jgi:hypothetical protein
VGGWYLRGWLSPDKAPILSLHAVVNRPVTPLSASAVGTMPSVIGLTTSEAQRALFDAGVTGNRVSTSSVASAGDSGLIVSQDPAAGADLSQETSSVQLGVSVAATMPNVIGKTTAEARDALANLGARVTVTQKYSPTAQEGTVLAVSPTVGATLPLTAALVVAAPASAVYLDQLSPISEDCSDVDSVTANAITYQHGLSCQPGQDSPVTCEYVLNRKVSAFSATIGQDDTGETGQTGTVAVVRDGKTIKTYTAGFGKQKRISVPMIGALRLSIVARWTNASADAYSGPTIVLANARMVGAPNAIDALVTESGR